MERAAGNQTDTLRCDLWTGQSVVVSRAAVTQRHVLGGLEQQTFVLSLFWRLQVQNQAVGSVGPFWRLWRKICSGSPFLFLEAAGNPWVPQLVEASLWSLFVLTWPPSLCLCVHILISCFLVEGHQSLDLESFLNPGWSHPEIVNYTCKDPISK